MKILVTGATGFIGGHLIERLRRDGHQICVVVRTTSDTSLLTKKNIRFFVFNDDINHFVDFLVQEKFNGIIHLASLFLAQHKTEDIKSLIDSNIYFSTALIECAAKAHIPWFINTGTFWQHYKNKKYSPVNLYAATKQAFEDIAQYYSEIGVLNFVTLKLSDTFGPNDTRPKVFNLWAKAIKTQETLEMSPGNQKIDISYIDNVVDAFVRLAELMEKDVRHSYSGKYFAVSSGKIFSLKKLAKIFAYTTGNVLGIDWGKKPYRTREVMMPWNKGRTVPGWKPKVTLEEGIRRTFKN